METTHQQSDTTALARVVIPEVVDLEIIRRDLGPSIDKELDRAARIQINIKDDETLALAVDAGEKLRDNIIDTLQGLRVTWYERLFYHPGEKARDLFDPRLKRAKGLLKDTMAAISDYKIKKEREARLAREKAEAEARRVQEEADRKQKEAEEAEARAKQAIEDEKRRIKEAEEAEARRIQAEKDAEERRQREAREAAAKETARKIKEEEDARLAHAQEAKDQGNDNKVDSIIENATPISPTMAAPQQAPDQETLRIERDLAQKRADEKAETERQAQAEAKRKQEAAADAAAKARAEADRAAAAAATAAAMAAATSAVVTRPDPRTTSVTRWKWDLDSDGTIEGDRKAIMTLLREIVEGRAPLEYSGFDINKPTDFRPTAVNQDVQKLKDRFACPGLKAYPEQNEQLRARRKVGGL